MASNSRWLATWVIVVALLVAGGLLIMNTRALTKDLAKDAPSKPAIAPVKATQVPAGAPAPVVEVASLRSALERGQWDELKAQLAKGVDVNAQMPLLEGATRRQLTLLAFAAMQRNAEAVRQLLALGADADAADATGTTPLMLAAALNDEATVKVLVEAKARVDRRNKWGQSAALMAAQSGAGEAMAALLAAGADAKAVDEEGNTLLSRVASTDLPVAAVQGLLKAGVDPNAANAEGVTPLMRAAERGDAEKVVALLAAGAKVDVKDTSGLSAADWARQRNDEAGNRVLAALGAK